MSPSPDPWAAPKPSPTPLRAWLGEGPGLLVLDDPVHFTSSTQQVSIPLASVRGCSVTWSPRPFWVVALAIVGAGMLQGIGAAVIWVVPWFWAVAGVSMLRTQANIAITAGDTLYTFAAPFHSVPAVRTLRKRAPQTHHQSSVLDLTVDGVLNVLRPESPEHRASGIRVVAAFLGLPLLTAVLLWLPASLSVISSGGTHGDHLFILGLAPPVMWFFWPLPALPGLYLWAWLQPTPD